jgi:hypothetical protein
MKLSNILNSFNNSSEGFSARKLTAFAFVLFTLYIHLRYIDKSNAIEALTIDGLMILLLLSIITFEQIIKFKEGNK